MTRPQTRGPHMADATLEKTINDAWEARTEVSTATKAAVREAVDSALEQHDSGQAREAERVSAGTWTVNQWLKKAVLLIFSMKVIHLRNCHEGRLLGE